MAQKEVREIYESRHEFVPPPEKRHKKRTKFKKAQAAAVSALLLAGILTLAPTGRTLPPPDAPGTPNAQPTEATQAPDMTQEPTVLTSEAFTELEPPHIELYPITMASEFTGVISVSEPERVLGMTVSVWETTQERMLTELEIPDVKYKTGVVPLPEWSFWDDYMEHEAEYDGSMLDGGNYRQQLRAQVSYDVGNGEIKTCEFTADPVEDRSFYWLWPAEEYDSLNGTSVARPDCVSVLLMTESMDGEAPAVTVLANEPDKVTDTSVYSVRAEIEGEPVEGVFITTVNGLPVVNIPIPAGVERQAWNIYQLYITKYVDGYGKAIEFIYENVV